jgi:penicillin-binding protein 2
VARLFSLQIIHGSEYKEQAQNRLVRAYPIKAPRGEIFDRYGRPMVTNRMGYYVQIQDVGNDDVVVNKTIYNLINIFEKDGIEYINDFPVAGDPFEFDFSRRKDPEKALADWKKEQKIEKYNTADEVVDYYIERYGISKDLDKTDAL